DAAAGATLGFGNSYTLAAGSSVTAAGIVSFNSGTVAVNGSYAVAGLTRIQGGTAQFPGTASTATLTITSGLLTGPGTFTGTGSLTWTGGQMTGTGTTVVAPGASFTLSGTGIRYLTRRTFRNQGSALWRDGGYLYLSESALFENAGTFELQTVNLFDGTDYEFYIGPAPTFRNTATLRKTTTTTATLSVPFVNGGALTVEGGTLNIS